MEIAFGKVRIDCKAVRGKRGKEPIELTPRELKVLSLLFRTRQRGFAARVAERSLGRRVLRDDANARSTHCEAPPKTRRDPAGAAPLTKRSYPRISFGSVKFPIRP